MGSQAPSDCPVPYSRAILSAPASGAPRSQPGDTWCPQGAECGTDRDCHPQIHCATFTLFQPGPGPQSRWLQVIATAHIHLPTQNVDRRASNNRANFSILLFQLTRDNQFHRLARLCFVALSTKPNYQIRSNYVRFQGALSGDTRVGQHPAGPPSGTQFYT